MLSKLIFSLFLAAGVVSVHAESIHAFQYGTIDALLAGAFEGDLTVKELEHKGDFGIGTYNRIDGEMILVDGIAYKAKWDGTVVVAGQSEQTPFAVATTFRPSLTLTENVPTTLKELEQLLDVKLANKNVFYAIRLQGKFKQIATRAIFPQDKPYKTLAEVAKTQSVFNFADTSGELIAFRSPPFSKGFNVPGYHWHFLSADKKQGGHVLSLTLENYTVSIMPLSEIDLKIPDNALFANADQTLDRAVELKTVESARKEN